MLCNIYNIVGTLKCTKMLTDTYFDLGVFTLRLPYTLVPTSLYCLRAHYDVFLSSDLIFYQTSALFLQAIRSPECPPPLSCSNRSIRSLSEIGRPLLCTPLCCYYKTLLGAGFFFFVAFKLFCVKGFWCLLLRLKWRLFCIRIKLELLWFQCASHTL